MTSVTPISAARPAAPSKTCSPSLAEERREVSESVLAALAHDAQDADRLAAGSYLLRHLSRTAASPWLF